MKWWEFGFGLPKATIQFLPQSEAQPQLVQSLRGFADTEITGIN